MGGKDIRVEERTLNEMDENDVKIQVGWSGICGSELHDYVHGPINFLPADTINPNTGKQSPLNMGHEFSGIVKEVGSAVNNVTVGDRVTVNPMLLPSGASPASHAEYVIVPENSIYFLPDSLPLEIGALVEPAATAVQAIKNSGMIVGDSVVVIGVGPIGLLTIIAAKAAGATTIIGIDLSENRLSKAKECGATHIINSGSIDPVEAVKEILPNGANITFEVAGVEPAFKQAIKTTKAGGKMVMVSVFTTEISWNPVELLFTGVSIIPSLAYTSETFQETIELITSGQLKPHGTVTEHITLDEIVSNGFEALINDKSQAKILIKLNGE